jgi:PD-(D/E)XK nuclease superfamily
MALTLPAQEIAPHLEPSLAARLAASIPIPTRLPVRYDGQPLRHLSATSYGVFTLCPDAYRRRYVLGVRESTAAVVFLGRVFDGALSEYHRHELATGERLAVEEVQEIYRRAWKAELEAEEDKLGVAWGESLDERTAHGIGEQAVAVALQCLVPNLGRPVAVQRRIEFRIGQVEWTVEGHLDLETEREDPFTGQLAPEIVDYKVKGDPIHQSKADRDIQAAIYLAGRWLEGRPAERFTFAQILRPGERRKRISTSLAHTTRTVGQLRATLTRLGLAASQIAWLYETFGPERPWGFAHPSSWKCSEKWCSYWESCPGGAGL